MAAPVATAAPSRAPSPFDAILGQSRAIRALRDAAHEILDRLASQRSPAPLLIAGETGTGKGLLATAMHQAGPRAGAPFMACSVTALPEQLVAAELFGYAAGAFDGSGGGKMGLFEAAHGGTILLDEARGIPPAVRRRVVKALQRGGVRRIGSTRLEPADVGVIATTASCDSDPWVDDRRRWHDLFAPLTPFTLTTPPLRERDDDVLLLAEHFLAHYGAEFGRPGMTLSEEARSVLREYVWPGNVRELSNTIERAVVMTPRSRIERDDLGWLQPTRTRRRIRRNG